MTYKEIVKNEEVNELLKKGNENLGILGFTDHSQIHCAMVARRAGYILKKFGYDAHDVEIVKIAGYMHDIGNAINRSHHAEYGSILAYDILKNTDLSLKDQVAIASAIGHHDESTGGATDPISAALIIADKTDVRRDRVREKPKASFDKHDRVNYAVTESKYYKIKFSICSVAWKTHTPAPCALQQKTTMENMCLPYATLFAELIVHFVVHSHNFFYRNSFKYRHFHLILCPEESIYAEYDQGYTCDKPYHESLMWIR